MKTALAAAALAATALIGSNVAASATTYNAVVVNNQYNSKAGGQKGAFTDTYTFVLSKAMDVYATFSGAGSLVKNMTASSLSAISFGIFSSTGSSTTPVLGGTIAALGPSLIGSTTEGTLGAGSYYVKVVDTFSGAKGTYNGNIYVSAVPLPGTVALFGVAVAGLGVAGAVRRKASKAAAL